MEKMIALSEDRQSLTLLDLVYTKRSNGTITGNGKRSEMDTSIQGRYSLYTFQAEVRRAIEAFNIQAIKIMNPKTHHSYIRSKLEAYGDLYFKTVYGHGSGQAPSIMREALVAFLDPKIIEMTEYYKADSISLRDYNNIVVSYSLAEDLKGLNRNAYALALKEMELGQFRHPGMLISSLKQKYNLSAAEWKRLLNFPPEWIKQAQLLTILAYVRDSSPDLKLPSNRQLVEMEKLGITGYRGGIRSRLLRIAQSARQTPNVSDEESAEQLPLISQYLSDFPAANPRTYKSAVKRSTRWHKRQTENRVQAEREKAIAQLEHRLEKAREENDQERIVILEGKLHGWQPTINATYFKVDGTEYHVRPLNTAVDMAEESARMGNCIGGDHYIEMGAKGKAEYYHIDKIVQGEDKPFAVMHLNNKFKIQQVKGPRNRKLENEDFKVTGKVVAMLKEARTD